MPDDPLPCSERLLAAVEAALAGLTLAGQPVPVERDRVLPVTEEDMPRLVIYQDAASTDQTVLTDTDTCLLTLAVAGYVSFPPAAQADRQGARQAAEAVARRAAATLQALVHQRLCGGDRPGDLAFAVEIRPAGTPPPDRLMVWQADPGRAFTSLFEIEFDTPTGDPFTFF
ncbi:hypothetical protein [Azospirillum picis]|uniref:Uncharacterized protein n=1 Tax=Azospirillum picis TaxID=488438 RepID=A0ABU0MVN6_9PROT|nr:hypothetical protein [Azospirillum picis]MBP2303324.1 hypothetical protein [Azospirillum picis]MDQ0537136.1 hypothetical protein [Azospirillum picis]